MRHQLIRLAHIQAILNQATDQASHTEMTMSYVEILKEDVFDLLAARPRVSLVGTRSCVEWAVRLTLGEKA